MDRLAIQNLKVYRKEEKGWLIFISPPPAPLLLVASAFSESGFSRVSTVLPSQGVRSCVDMLGGFRFSTVRW
ncbi:unnamed protein product, partial [Vitis vinifera]